MAYFRLNNEFLFLCCDSDFHILLNWYFHHCKPIVIHFDEITLKNQRREKSYNTHARGKAKRSTTNLYPNRSVRVDKTFSGSTRQVFLT